MNENRRYYYLKLKENFYHSETMVILESIFRKSVVFFLCILYYDIDRGRRHGFMLHRLQRLFLLCGIDCTGSACDSYQGVWLGKFYKGYWMLGSDQTHRLDC